MEVGHTNSRIRHGYEVGRRRASQSSVGGSGHGFRHSSWVVQNGVIAVAGTCEGLICDAIRSQSPVCPVPRYGGAEAALGKATPRTDGRLRRAKGDRASPPKDHNLMSQGDELKL
jgi:hypothetical protein